MAVPPAHPDDRADEVATESVYSPPKQPAVSLLSTCSFCRSADTSDEDHYSHEIATRELLDTLQLETNQFAWWWAIRAACARALDATDATIYLYDKPDRHWRPLQRPISEHLPGRSAF